MADKTIGDLTEADTLDGTELFETEQGGNSRKTTLGTAASKSIATASEIAAGTANKVITADGLEDALDPATSTASSALATDWSSEIVRDVTASGDITLSNPTNVEPGTSRMAFIYGDDTTERSLSFGTSFKGALPDETVTSTKGLLLVMTARATDYIVLTWKVIEE